VGYCSDELVVVVGGYDYWVVKAEIFGCHGGDVVFLMRVIELRWSESSKLNVMVAMLFFMQRDQEHPPTGP
jgi:hypothetical protein